MDVSRRRDRPATPDEDRRMRAAADALGDALTDATAAGTAKDRAAALRRLRSASSYAAAAVDPTKASARQRLQLRDAEEPTA